MAQEKMYQEALDAIRQGQRVRAKDLLTRLLSSDSSRSDYWLWMSTLVDTHNERVFCLESALRADPSSEAARRGLIILGARTAGPEVKPVPPIRRNWQKDLDKGPELPQPFFRRFWDNPILRLFLFISGTVLLIGLVLVAIYGIQMQRDEVAMFRVSPFPSRTPQDTETPTPTLTPIPLPSTPFIGPTPLWMYLTETYTPVPIYINTPHQVVEAYRIGINAYENNQIEQMLDYMQQAVTFSPNDPDLHYYVGEAHRLLGDFEPAIAAFEQGIEVNPYFAPNYLGRALANLGINENSVVDDDLGQAILLDPYYTDAYLTRAAYRVFHGEPETALEDLNIAEIIFPGKPMIYVLTAQAYLELGDYTIALQNARLGYE